MILPIGTLLTGTTLNFQWIITDYSPEIDAYTAYEAECGELSRIYRNCLDDDLSLGFIKIPQGSYGLFSGECECGADKVRAPHSHWCPKFGGAK